MVSELDFVQFILKWDVEESRIILVTCVSSSAFFHLLFIWNVATTKMKPRGFSDH